jgi:uncharacterized membrane protein
MRSAVDRHFRWLLLALALTCMAGMVFKTHCTPGGWTNSEQYTTGCYSDAVPFWTQREVYLGKMPYFESRMEYPVLTGAAIWVEGSAVRLLLGQQANEAAFLIAVTLVNIALAFLVLGLLWRAGADRRRLWAWAVAPPLILYVGHNWDMIAVTFTVLALLAARAGRLVKAGAAAGLGVAAKLFPIVMLPLLGLSALAAGGNVAERVWRAAMMSAAAIGAWAVVNLPVALLAPENWSEFYRFSQERGGTASATWEVLSNLGLVALDGAQKNKAAAALFVLGAAAIIGFGWRRHGARLWVLTTPVVAWFMLTNKVYSPQFDLWLYPLLVMTAPRLGPVMLFAFAGIGAYFAEFWLFAGMDGASPSATYASVACWAIARAGIMVWLIADCVVSEAPGWLSRTASAPAGD